MALRNRTRPRAYDLKERIAAGGMGEVYRARAPGLHQAVAVKRMLDAEASDEDLKLMFLREVAVAATLDHPNVVEVIDAGQNGLELFLVMEYVDGPSLAEITEVLRRQNKILPVEVSCHIVSSVAIGLAHAHHRALPNGTPLGIVHRDVAAANVLMGTDGVPKVVDFGLAKLSGHSLTNPGVVRGRPRSLSPEQAKGDPVDPRSDLFSLGAMLFELTAGQPLYKQEAVASLLWKVAHGAYDPIAPRLSHIDPDLIEIVETALAVDPNDRFQSARQMERALHGFRAARGMRVSSRALAQVVAVTWPAVRELREQRLEGCAGELEDTRLILPSDDLEGHERAELVAPTAARKAKRKGEPRRARGSRSSEAPHRTSSVPPAAFTHELSPPGFPRGPPVPRDRVIERRSWLIYTAVVLTLAMLAFIAAWWAGGPSP